MLGVAGTKAVALVTMAILTLIFSMLPLYVRNLLKGKLEGKKAQAALSACLCFGGGVLLATVFLHLIPEARLLTQRALDNHFLPHTNYPIAELIVCGGFFLIYIIEHIVHTCSAHNHHSPKKEKTKGSSSPDIIENEHVPLKPIANESNEDDLMNKKSQQNTTTLTDAENGSSGSPVAQDEEKPVDTKEGLPTLKAMIFVVAFSFHSIMEGLALGLVNSSRDVWFLFAALLAHKIVIAFCMAMELLEVGVTLIGFLASMIIFSLASPIGGLLGTLIVSFATNNSPAGFVTTTILQGISAGTILYVTFCEVLERERSKEDGGTTRTISLILGFCAMAVLQIFDDEAMIQTQEHISHLNTTGSPVFTNTTETAVFSSDEIL
ncbi:zinc transporter ZIP1-like [Palaemon carinicauda]|uniref:zinc transporter ZIP1-like n=1 Tax=Palaemon carinicauda TaxID=392227 RepID=UPI0035B645CE